MAAAPETAAAGRPRASGGSAPRLPRLSAVGLQRSSAGLAAEEQEHDLLLRSLQSLGAHGAEPRDLGRRLAHSHAALRERHNALRDEYSALCSCLHEAGIVSEAGLRERARARASARLFGRLVGTVDVAKRILLWADIPACSHFCQTAPLCVASLIGVVARLSLEHGAAGLRRLQEAAGRGWQEGRSGAPSQATSPSGSGRSSPRRPPRRPEAELSGSDCSEGDPLGSRATSSRSSWAPAARAAGPRGGGVRPRRPAPPPPPRGSSRASSASEATAAAEALRHPAAPALSPESSGADSALGGDAAWELPQPEQLPSPSALLRPRAGASEDRKRLSALGSEGVRRVCALAGPQGMAGLEACSRAALASVRAQRGVYLCGGCSEKAALQSLFCFNPQEGTWASLPDMRYPRDGAASVTLAGCLYVLGGNNRERFAQFAECYDPWKGAWRTLPEMSRTRFLPCAAVLNGQIYVCGGEVRKGLPLASVERFAPSRCEWQSVAMMAQPRRAAMAAALGGQLCVCGGSGPVSEERALSTVECYDPGSNAWRAAPRMSEGRSFAGAVTLGRRLYMFAGLCSGNGSLGTAECLEAVERPWRPLPSLSVPRYGPAVATVDAWRIVVCGGCTTNPRSVSDCAEIFDCASEAWVEVQRLLRPRCFSVIAATPTRVYVCGGIGAAGLLDSAEQLDLATGEWRLLPTMPAKVSCAVGGGLLAP